MATGASNKLAPTTFETQPDNSLEVVDVYESEGGGIENSFQDAYHKVNDTFDSVSSLAKSAIGQATDAASGLKGKFNEAKGLLNTAKGLVNAVKSGNINSLLALTGGTANGLKQLADVAKDVTNGARQVTGIVNDVTSGIRQATGIVNEVTTFANSLKGGLNANAILNRLVGNLPLARQINDVIRGVGNIDSAFDSLERSLGRASGLLGGDNSSLNTAVNGVRNKITDSAMPKAFDNAVTTPQVQAMVEQFSAISPEISSAIKQLPDAVQAALVNGFSDDAASLSPILGNSEQAIKINPLVKPETIAPLQSIVEQFSGKPSDPVTVQAPGNIAGLIAGVTNVATKAGMKDTFTKMTENIENKDVLMAAAKPLVLRAIQEGDLDTIMDLSKSKVSQDIASFAPDLIEGTCYNLLRPQGMSQQEFAPYYEDIKTAFEAINPEWDTYTTTGDQKLINGTCIASNAFMCDIIEAKLNETTNTAITDTTRQVIKQKQTKPSNITDVKTEVIKDTFSEDLEREIDRLNKESWLNEDDSILQPIPTTQPPTTQAPVDPDEDQEEIKIKDYSNEPFLLLASVYINNSVDSELEFHFPELYQRFKQDRVNPI
jgi:methyl-accepting chemotaxis protein